jgi:hypothetical protein
MSELRDRLIERTLDRQAGHNIVAMGRGETFENEKWRVHRYADAIEITQLENAGKRGKKCMTFYLSGGTTIESTSDEFMMLGKRGADFGRMQQAFKEALETGWQGRESWLRGVDVKPGAFKELIVRGAHVTVIAGYDQYSIEDINDENNAPTCIARGKKSVGQFYRWVKDNARAIQSMTYNDILQALGREGIDHHDYCAMD